MTTTTSVGQAANDTAASGTRLQLTRIWDQYGMLVIFAILFLLACVLVGLGVDELSVSARSIPEVKARVRELSMDRLKTLAADALGVGSPDEVRQLVEAL